MPAFYRPTWVEISPSSFASNIRQLKKWVGAPVSLLAVLKADAYGHGANVLAPVAIEAGASIIGVSSLDEAVSLRDHGIKAPILILGGIYPLENFSVCFDYNLIPLVASLEAIQFLAGIAKQKNKSIDCHLKVDTGMGRIGVSVPAAKKILEWAVGEKSIRIAGIFSHLSSADSDSDFTNEQIAHFAELKAFAVKNGFVHAQFHLANSAATMNFPQAHHHLVRPGLASYGASSTAVPAGLKISPVLSWRTKSIYFKKAPAGTPISYGRTFITKKETDIVTLPVGYADGVPRAASNKAFVLVKGKKCPVIGRITMDHMMVDVTGLQVTVGEPVVLIGRQGDETITASDWAGWAGTIPYEIFCGISKRVPRVVIT